MRVLFAALSGYGHVYPMLSLACAVRDAGHEVHFATGDDFGQLLASLRFEFFPVGITMSAAAARAGMAGVNRGRPTAAGVPGQIGTVFGSVLPRQVVRDLEPVLPRSRPDLVIYEETNLGAALAALAAGLPAVAHGISHARAMADAVDAITAELAPVAAELGVALPAGPLTGLAGAYLDVYPMSLQDKAFLRRPNRVPLRPVAFAEPGELPEWPSGRHEPLVYVTLGTAFGAVPLLKTVATALAPLDVRVLLAAGPSVDVRDLAGLPENVVVRPWVPQAAALARADVVVHHGGSGTTLGALAAGVPQLIVPQGADQFVNAEVVSSAGCGEALITDHVGPPEVADAVRRLLKDDLVRSSASLVAEEILRMPTPDEVARRLPQLTK